MRIAIYAPDRDERHALSQLVEDALLACGVLPEISLFPMLPEMIQAARRYTIDIALLCRARDFSALRSLTRLTRVALVSEREDAPAAFDIGVRSFVETPVTAEKIRKALDRCLNGMKDFVV